MAVNDFQEAVLEQLAKLQQGQGQVLASQVAQAGQIQAIFHKLDGNGQPGLIADVAHLRTEVSNVRTNCAAIQANKAERTAEETNKQGLHWMAWAGIATAVIGSVSTFILELLHK